MRGQITPDTDPNLMIPRTAYREMQAKYDRLYHEAELLVTAAMDVLPIEGSWNSGYRVCKRVDTVVRATPEEWATAAHHLCEVHALIAGLRQEERP